MHTEHRIFKQAVFPLVMLMVVLAIGAFVNLSAHRLAKHQAMSIEDSFLAAKRAELQNYIDLAKSAIASLSTAPVFRTAPFRVRMQSWEHDQEKSI